MLTKILNLATFLTVLWLLWSNAEQSQRIEFAEREQAASHNTLRSQIADASKALQEENQMERLKLAAALPASAAVSPQDNANTEALKQEVSNYQARLHAIEKSAELEETLTTVARAEFSKTTDPGGAAEMLLSTKETIWRLSTENAPLEQTLQNLMAPIDILASEWNDGYTNNSVATIYKILADSINVIQNSPGPK